MKAVLILLALLMFAVPALADHHEGAEAPAMPAMGKPAEMDALAFMHGEWNVAMEFKMTPDATEWMTTSGTVKVTPMLNGCVNHTEFSAMLMGMPFNGFDNTTYNREYGRYESVWVDDMSAKMSVMRGNFEGDKLVMTGEDKMEGLEFLSRAVSEKRSNDEVFWSMAMSTDGGETWFENMRMTYTRKK